MLVATLVEGEGMKAGEGVRREAIHVIKSQGKLMICLLN